MGSLPNPIYLTYKHNARVLKHNNLGHPTFHQKNASCYTSSLAQEE